MLEKRGYIFTNLHGVTCQKVARCTVTPVYLVLCSLHYEEDLMPFYEHINVCSNFRVISSRASTIQDVAEECTALQELYGGSSSHHRLILGRTN